MAIAYVDLTTDSNVGTGAVSTLAVPATAAAGQLCLFLCVDGGNTTTPSITSGWNLISNTSVHTTTYGTDAWYKVLTSGDVGSTVTLTHSAGLGSSLKRDYYAVVYSGASLGSSQVVGETVARTTHTCPAVNVVSSTGWIVNLVMDRGSPGSSNMTLPANLRQRYLSIAGGGASPTVVVADDDAVGAGSKGANTVTGTLSTDNAAMMTIALEPAATFTANAGADQINVEPGKTVTLIGTDSGSPTVRNWTQINGTPTVSLSVSGSTATFTASPTINGTTQVFQFAVGNGTTTVTDTVSVTTLGVTERAASGGSAGPLIIRSS